MGSSRRLKRRQRDLKTERATTDTRITYGARCSWWDSIDKVGTVPGSSGLPGCPFCGSPLYEVDSLAEFMKGAYARGEDYVAMIEWSRGKCFGKFENLEASWEEHKS